MSGAMNRLPGLLSMKVTNVLQVDIIETKLKVMIYCLDAGPGQAKLRCSTETGTNYLIFKFLSEN